MTPEATSASGEPLKRRRWPVVLGVAAAALLAVAVLVTRDQSRFQPDTGEMEEIAGVALEAPRYVSSSAWSRWTREARVWRRYWTQPLPNQMAVQPRENTWTYPFEASASYRPPETSNLACHGGNEFPLTCESVAAERWFYVVEFDASTGRGLFTAGLLTR